MTNRFRAELRRDPEGTVRARNIELNEDEWAALRSVDWSLSDEAAAGAREQEQGG